MAKETSKTVEWSEVLETASANSGIPKKQLEADVNETVKAVEQLLEKYQPKKVGDATSIMTPFVVVSSTRIPESIVTDQNGNKFTRQECCAVNTCVRTSFINAANIGLVSDAAVEKASSKKASA